VTSAYAAEAASAYEDIKAAGSAVTFRTASPGTFDPATGTYTDDTTTSVVGAAIRIGANPILYQALNLVTAEAPTLLFAPATAGALPPLGATVMWGGETYTVKNVTPVAPDGTAILARVVVAR
jgi:ABC-type transport system substrate-binding protein